MRYAIIKPTALVHPVLQGLLAQVDKEEPHRVRVRVFFERFVALELGLVCMDDPDSELHALGIVVAYAFVRPEDLLEVPS